MRSIVPYKLALGPSQICNVYRAMPQRGEIVHPYMFYTHMLCKRKAQFFRHTEYFLDVLQLYSSSSTGQWSLPCTSIKISAFLICGASRSDTRK